MLLRTSSSPGIKGAIFTVLSETPLRDFHNPTPTNSSSSSSRHHHKKTPSRLNFPPSSPSSSSSSGKTSPSELNREAGKGGGGFRRAWSDSNIDRFAASSAESKPQQQSVTPGRYPPRKRMLHSAPSFSIFTTTGEEEEEQKDGGLVRTVTIGDNIEAGEFSFEEGKKNSMGLIEEVEEQTGEEEDEDDDDGDQRRRGLTLKLNTSVVIPPSLSFVEDEKQPASPPMYLAAGLGFDTAIDFQAASSLLDFDEGGDLEEYYRKMLDQFPIHPLFLRNYAHLLQSKGDLHGAEEYYHRATLVEPGDGEVLMQYAKLVWELHRDRDRAEACFERAAQAAPQDSNVLGAYASFLWEVEDAADEEVEDEEEKVVQKEEQVQVLLSAFSANNGEPIVGGGNGGLNVEDYYRQMVEENPNNALVLRNYAQFLSQIKGDKQGAEEYYSRAILADPSDGEIMSQYAKLVWQLHRDQEKASSYFERAVQAAPTDSHVLAAYASFLWESEEDEEVTDQCDQLLGSIQPDAAIIAAAN